MTTENELAQGLKELANMANKLANEATVVASNSNIAEVSSSGDSFFITALTVFVLACFVGYYVVWRVTPALHSPLMAITNAISSVIIVGALIAVGLSTGGISQIMGFLAIILASINIFGGFIVTRRMLHMFKKKG